MKIWLRKTLFICFTLFQIAALLAAAALEYLSDKRMGVARYLVYKNEDFATGSFSPAQMNLYSIILISGFILSLIGLIYFYFKLKNSKITWTMSLGTLTISITQLLIWLKQSFQLNAYYFFLIALFIIIVAQYLKLLLRLQTHQND